MTEPVRNGLAWTALKGGEWKRLALVAWSGWYISANSQRGYLRLVALYGLAIAPFWIFFAIYVFGLTIYVLFGILGAEAEDLRWQAMAAGTLLVALLGLVGAPLALIRIWTTERQTYTVEQGHVTDRLTKAIEQLGAEKTVKVAGKDADGKPVTIERTEPNIEVRLGGIFALERLAQDSIERDHVSVMETLCAYIRQNAPASAARNFALADWPERPSSMTDSEQIAWSRLFWVRFGYNGNLVEWVRSLPVPRADVQAALTVIGRRGPAQIARERRGDRPYRLDLHRTCLQRANLEGARLEDANLGGARLEGADLFKARMDRANLHLARLDAAHLFSASLVGAALERAWLQRADLADVSFLEKVNAHGVRLEGASLVGAHLMGTHLGDARLEGADLSGARLEGANLKRARLEFASLDNARARGADFRKSRRTADLREVHWDGATLIACFAQFADFRGAKALMQAQLDGVIGNPATLLPDQLSDCGEAFYVWSGWKQRHPAIELSLFHNRPRFFWKDPLDQTPDKWTLSADNPRTKSGKPLDINAAYPAWHILARIKRT